MKYDELVVGDESAPADGDLTSRVISGARWKAISALAVQIARLAVQVILARLLLPEDFGVVAVAIVVLNFLDIVMDLGTGVTIIQRKRLEQSLASAIFVANAVIGLGLCIATVASAGILADLFGTPQATRVVQVMALALIISSLARTQHAILKRRMSFRSLAKVDVAGALSNAVIAIPAALLGAGAWALVGGHLSSVLLSTLVAYRVSGWLPSRPFAFRGLLTVAQFSLNMVGSQLTRFALQNVDKMIVGRFLGAGPLGVYAVAERFMKYPVIVLAQGITDVMLPAFSRTQDNPEAFRRGVLRALGAVTLVTVPLMVGLATVAAEFTLVVLGPQWQEVVPLLRVLGPAGAIQAIVHACSIVFVALGQANKLFRLTLVTGAVNTAAYLIGVQWGLNGLAIAYGISVALMAVPNIVLPLRLAGVSLRSFVAVMLPYVVATTSLALGVSVATHLAATAFGPAVSLVAGVATGAFTYVAVLVVFRPPALQDVLRLIGLDRKLHVLSDRKNC